jgi:diguanylate cyclase (GGDEF)-like protein
MNNPETVTTDIDLILMDIVMPDINGIEACRLIKAVEYLQDIPIIMVTASNEIGQLQMAFAVGATDYITKPFNKLELLARVQSALRLKYEIDRRKEREKELLEATRQLAEANWMLQRLSSLDGLTGVANRRRFDEVLEQEWRRALRNKTPLSLIFIDIDFFKVYNDTYGHLMGDECLKQIAKTLSGILNRPGDLVARYGGEEFVVLLPETDTSGAITIAETLRTKVEEMKIPHLKSECSNYVTISLGVATAIPSHDSSASWLIDKADKALYQAKQEGRNQLRCSEVSPCLAVGI